MVYGRWWMDSLTSTGYHPPSTIHYSPYTIHHTSGAITLDYSPPGTPQSALRSSLRLYADYRLRSTYSVYSAGYHPGGVSRQILHPGCVRPWASDIPFLQDYQPPPPRAPFQAGI